MSEKTYRVYEGNEEPLPLNEWFEYAYMYIAIAIERLQEVKSGLITPLLDKVNRGDPLLPEDFPSKALVEASLSAFMAKGDATMLLNLLERLTFELNPVPRDFSIRKRRNDA